jgi:ribulose-5-phosphate 4-epimerase/fuculose-1-phosphate aldolase
MRTAFSFPFPHRGKAGMGAVPADGEGEREVMQSLVEKYAAQAVARGLVEPDGIVIGGLDDELVWSTLHPERAELETVFRGLNINSLLWARPAEPYASVLAHLAGAADGAIHPEDTETRTFLHDLPVAGSADPAAVIAILRRRKSAILPGPAVVTFGTVSPEQAFVSLCSVLFATTVKLLADALAAALRGTLGTRTRELAAALLTGLPETPTAPRVEEPDPPTGEAAVHRQLAAAGRALVEHDLVDSFFGNLSLLHGDVLHISRSGAALDDLEGRIDPCPLNGSRSVGLTASSELGTHLRIVEAGGVAAVLHGHPRFAVALSLDCAEEDCPGRGACHLRCDRERFAVGVPVVPGEVGSGPHGLVNTVPQAIARSGGAAIVHGHGVFTTGRHGFDEALSRMFDIERACRAEVAQRISSRAGSAGGW